MIIEIKDLPAGRRVQKITFDITFEDGSTDLVKPLVKQHEQHEQHEPALTEGSVQHAPKSESDLKPLQDPPVPKYSPTPSSILDPISATDVASTDARTSKPIPNEMKDFEF